MPDLKLRDVYRCTHVERWNVVDTVRRQNVAEHQYLVALVVDRYCTLLGLGPSVRGEAVVTALKHDLAEVLTGDVPTPTKRHLNGSFEELERSVTFDGRDTRSTQRVKELVNFADLVEAAVWLGRYGLGSHARKVRRHLETQLLELDPENARLLLYECEEVEETLPGLSEGVP